MIPLRTWLAILAAKSSAKLSKALHVGAGTSLPGKLARKLDPTVLLTLQKTLLGPRIAVSGTNGKTTTCGLLAAFLQASGKQVLHNQLGANMLAGITGTVAQQSNFWGHLTANTAVLEVDEASLKGVAQEIRLDHVVVTNLFRDQLDRYGELDTTAKLIAEGTLTPLLKEAVGKAWPNGSEPKTVYLNADDPLVRALAPGFEAAGLRVVFFGIQTTAFPIQHTMLDTPASSAVVPFPREAFDCPTCGQPLQYNQVIYGHLGHYACVCGFHRPPEPDVQVTAVSLSPLQSQVTITQKTTGLRVDLTVDLTLALPGLFNVYNLLAAVSVALQLGIPPDCLKQGLARYHSVFGRAERLSVQGKTVMILLIKNPVGASEVLRLVAADPKARLLVALNDNYADGRDISWIWDAAFECLPKCLSDRSIVLSGHRAADLAVRLKYAGCLPEQLQIQENLQQAVQLALSTTQPDETLYVLPTYTALLELNQKGYLQ